METHGTQPSYGRQEIQCSDCGHLYLIAGGQESSLCQKCGNINLGRGRLVEEKEVVAEEPSSPLVAFQAIPDGNTVSSIAARYQIEWQLWAKVVEHFSDPAFHAAYLTQALALEFVAEACARYRDHRSVMMLVEENRWQAEVADLMLARLESLAAVQMERAGKKGFELPAWWVFLPTASGVARMGWILLGMALCLRLIFAML